MEYTLCDAHGSCNSNSSRRRCSEVVYPSKLWGDDLVTVALTVGVGAGDGGASGGVQLGGTAGCANSLLVTQLVPVF